MRSYIKKIAYEINSKEMIEGDEEENEEENEEIQQTRKRSISIATIQSPQRNVNHERKSSFFDLNSPKPALINKNCTPKEIEIKNLQGSLKFWKSNEKNLVSYNVCIPQNPFSQVSIDYNAENEKNFHNIEVNEDRFEGQINYNYSFKPRKDKKSEKINESSDEINKEDLRIYEAVGFALSDTVSLNMNNSERFEKFEIKKGDPVCIRVLKDGEFVECKYLGKIGVFPMKDFYFWENKIAYKPKDEDIISPVFKDKPLKPNFFTRSHM